MDEFRQTSVPGIFSCGNVLHVHDLVDYVSKEAEITGEGAYRYINGRSPSDSDYLQVIPGKGIRYVVPQRIYGDSDVEFYFRSNGIYKDGTVELTDGEKVLASKRLMRMVPGQMERLILKRELLTGVSKTKKLQLRWRNRNEEDDAECS